MKNVHNYTIKKKICLKFPEFRIRTIYFPDFYNILKPFSIWIFCSQILFWNLSFDWFLRIWNGSTQWRGCSRLRFSVLVMNLSLHWRFEVSSISKVQIALTFSWDYIPTWWCEISNKIEFNKSPWESSFRLFSLQKVFVWTTAVCF